MISPAQVQEVSPRAVVIADLRSVLERYDREAEELDEEIKALTSKRDLYIGRSRAFKATIQLLERIEANGYAEPS